MNWFVVCFFKNGQGSLFAGGVDGNIKIKYIFLVLILAFYFYVGHVSADKFDSHFCMLSELYSTCPLSRRTGQMRC